jgi:hypothetical protein
VVTNPRYHDDHVRFGLKDASWPILSIPERENLGETLKQLWQLELAMDFWKCKVGSRHDSA